MSRLKGVGGGGEAAAEHLTSGMLHLHGQLVSKPVADLRGGVRGVRPPPLHSPASYMQTYSE